MGKMQYHSPAPGSRSWDDFLDVDNSQEDIETSAGRPRAASRAGPSDPATAGRLLAVSAALRKEVQGLGHTPVGSRRGSFSHEEGKEKASSVDGTTAAPSISGAGIASGKLHGGSLDRPTFLRTAVRPTTPWRGERGLIFHHTVERVRDEPERGHRPAAVARQLDRGRPQASPSGPFDPRAVRWASVSDFVSDCILPLQVHERGPLLAAHLRTGSRPAAAPPCERGQAQS